MGLVTEADKLEAFKATYPGKHKVLKPSAGIGGIGADSGFRILTFDPESGYTQFTKAELFSKEYIEFAQTNDRNPIQRRRYYDRFLSLHLAWINYPFLPEGILGSYRIEWEFFCEGSKEAAPSDNPTMYLYLPDTEGDVPLVECRYRNNELLPDRIAITAGTLDEALNVFKTTKDQKRTSLTSSVPLAFIIRPRRSFDDYAVFGVKDPSPFNFRLGLAEPGQRFTHPEFPGALLIEPSKDGLKIVREDQEDQTETSLIVPRLDFQDVYQRLRGNWRAYAAFPQRYPVNFQISSAR